MSISGTEGLLRDFSTSGDLISDEIIKVPATSPYTVYPEFTPQKATPSSVNIWTSANKTGTQYTERTSESLVSASGDFFVNYNRGGLMTFHSTAAGLSFFGTYNEIGTFLRVKQINDMRTVIGSGDISDAGGHTNLVSHANDSTLHGTSSGDNVNIGRHSGDPGAHSNYAYKPGRSGGQILKGGIGVSENLTLQSTADTTRGKILLGSGSGAYDEANSRFGIGTQNPSVRVHASGDTASEIRADSSSGWAGFSIKPQGMLGGEIIYLWSDVNEKQLRIDASGSTRAKFFSSDAMLDVSGDARFLGGIKFIGSNPSIIRLSGDISILPNRRMGVATQNPVSLLDISGDVHFSNDIGFSGLPTIIRSSGDIVIYPNSKIGIGGNPSKKFDVSGDVQMTGFYLPVAPTAGYVLVSDASGGGTWQANTSAGGAGGSVETIDEYTVLLLHCNGSNGSTSFIDSSLSGHTIYASGDVRVDTAQYKFGAASGLFDGSTGFLSITDSEDWNFAGGNFTIDFWARFNSLTMPGGNGMVFLGQNPSTSRNFAFFYRPSSNGVVFSYSTDGSTFKEIIFPWGPVINTWYHLALVRNLSNLLFFVNGALIDSKSISTDIIFNSSADFYIGENVINRGYYFNGWLDEIRISKGIARWLGSFTPPTKEYGKSVVGDLITGLFGKVGIRTTTPQYPLDVSGDARVLGNLYLSGDFILSKGAVNGYVLTSNNQGNATWQAPAGGGWTDDGTIVRPTTLTDRVGVGTANPVRLFDVSGDTQFGNSVNFSGLPTVIRSSGDLTFMPVGVIGMGLTNPASTDKLSILLQSGQRVLINKGAEGTEALAVSGYIYTINGAFGFGTKDNSDFTFRVNSVEVARFTTSPNLGIYTADQFGGGVKVIGIANATTAPTSSPIGGGVLYSIGGAGTWRGSSGTVTTFGPAEPHCPVCGRDFVWEWKNEKTGHLIVCVWCLTEKLGNIGVVKKEIK